MTEENTEDVEEVEQAYDYPEYREVGERTFLEGEVGALEEYCAEDGDYYVYEDYAVAAEVIDALSEHPEDARVQVHTTEYEDEKDTCPGCGKKFKAVNQHWQRSDCPNPDGTDFPEGDN